MPLLLCGGGVQVFYATIGASANIGLVVTTAPVLFLFSFIALAGHLTFLFGVGSLLGFSRRELLIASNANIGGACCTSPAMATLEVGADHCL